MYRAAEFAGVHGGVGVAQPEHRERRAALAQHLLAETRSHGTIARGVLGDVEPSGAADRHQAGREGAGAVIDVAVPVGILEIGGAGRDIGEHDRTAGVAQAFGQRWSLQGATQRLAHGVAELRRTDIVHDHTVTVGQAHGVAVQAVPCRMAAGGDRRRGGARHRWEDAAMIPEAPAEAAEIDDRRAQLGPHEVATMPVADHQHHASIGHVSPAPANQRYHRPIRLCHPERSEGSSVGRDPSLSSG